MFAQALDGVIVALEFLLGEHRMNLRMAGPADTYGLLHPRTIELPLVALIVMTRARDEVMPGERFLSSADGAETLHQLMVDS